MRQVRVVFKMLIIGGIGMTLQADSIAQETTSFRGKPIIKTVIEPLTVGDKVPDISIRKIINYTKPSARLSDFKGKLLILDFWETYCASCIAALPYFQDLQEKFKNKVQFINVTRRDTKEKILRTLQRFSGTRNLTLPIAINDEELYKYFPFEIVSHLVWIDENGFVKAITGKEYVTEGNIRLALQNNQLDWPIKKDVADFNYKEPLVKFSSESVKAPRPLYYSAFSSHLEGLDSHNEMITDSSQQIITQNFFNASLLQLCQGAADGEIGGLSPKDVVFEVKDRNKYLKNNPYESSWDSVNLYCYSISIPLQAAGRDMKLIIKQDVSKWLDWSLGITVKKEERLVDILVLGRSIPDNGLIQSKGGEKSYFNKDKPEMRLTNVSFGELTWYINEFAADFPRIFDETGIPQDFLVDIKIRNSSLRSLADLKNDLKPYGLELKEQKMKREIYIISEMDGRIWP